VTRADLRHLDCHARKRLIVELAISGIAACDIAAALQMNEGGIVKRLYEMRLAHHVNPRFNTVIG
jgi:hypothetical protein